MQFFIENSDQREQALREIRDHPFPYFLTTESGRSDTKEWKDLNAFFHSQIVPLFSSLTGYERKEAKEQLQVMNALIEEHSDYYEVESISGMSYDRLCKFNEACQRWMRMNYGVYAQGKVKAQTKKILK